MKMGGQVQEGDHVNAGMGGTVSNLPLQGLGRSVDLLQHQRAALRHECVGSSALRKFSWSYLFAVQQK